MIQSFLRSAMGWVYMMMGGVLGERSLAVPRFAGHDVLRSVRAIAGLYVEQEVCWKSGWIILGVLVALMVDLAYTAHLNLENCIVYGL